MVWISCGIDKPISESDMKDKQNKNNPTTILFLNKKH